MFAKCVRSIWLLASCCLALLLLMPASAWAGSLTVLCYHDVVARDQVNPANPWTVTEDVLDSHFRYLRDNGYQVISLDDYLAASKGEKALPDKAVLLSFDDGYISFYETVFPLLQRYDYSAVLAVVGNWLDGTPPSDVGKLLNWEQLRTLAASGRVEVASHTYDLHRLGNMTPQGDGANLAKQRLYNGDKYETQTDFDARIASDFAAVQAVFQRELGHAARVLVWPYGHYSGDALRQAKAAGFLVTFGLDGEATLGEKNSLPVVKRGIIYGNPDARRFAAFLNTGMAEWRRNPMRLAQVDLDLIYDVDRRQMDENIRQLLERLARSEVTAVALQSFADPKGDGNVEQAYFWTQQAPVKADVFSHVSRRLAERGYRVFAWLPTLSGQWLLTGHPEDAVAAAEATKAGWYRRATPFSARVQQKLNNLVDDLFTYAWVDGVLFQDDLYLNDYEDFSSAAKTAYAEAFGRQLTPDIRDDAIRRAEWTAWKTRSINQLTADLTKTIRYRRPDALVLRNIYAMPVLKPYSEDWYAQRYDDYLQHYDYTVIMAYPYMEKEGKAPGAWLEKLAQTALRDPGDAQRVIFKLQTYDWEKKRWLSDKELRQQVAALKKGGARHIGYYPEVVFDAKIAPLPATDKEAYDQP